MFRIATTKIRCQNKRNRSSAISMNYNGIYLLCIAKMTLTKIAELLRQPQHRLIYLCEKSVIIPDRTDAKSCGSSRRFSERNLFEFSVALTLREFRIPTVISKSILSVIQSFEIEVQQHMPEFSLPRSLATPESPNLNVVLT